MNIIEREIAKRQEIIDGKAEKVATLEALKVEIEALEEAIADIDEETLLAEIEELKDYLPKDDVADDTSLEA